MYARMMAVSTRLDGLRTAPGVDPAGLAEAEQALHRGQCNCAYWHGAFGGIYLPHLRNAIYTELIAADAAADRAEGRTGPRLDVAQSDFDFDGRDEIRVTSDMLDCWLAPARGGILYELDLRGPRHNLLATLDRRPEAYHAQVLAGPGAARSIVDASQVAKFKQEGLERMVRYDRNRRKSLVDHFWDLDVTAAAIVEGTAAERGDFAAGVYALELHRTADRIELRLRRGGNAWGIPFTLTKTVCVRPGSPTIDIAYGLSDLPADFRQHLAVEFNFAGMPAQADGRFFYDAAGQSLGELGTCLDLPAAARLGLVDDWLGIDAALSIGRASNGAEAGIWTFPIQTVSQSEGGFELVHQSVVVMPHWIVTPDPTGTWRAAFRLTLGGRRSSPA
jgi:alpha-amylase